MVASLLASGKVMGEYPGGPFRPYASIHDSAADFGSDPLAGIDGGRTNALDLIQIHQMTPLAWGIFLLAAIMEVGGDALVRKGLRGGGLLLITAGFVALGSYGIVVNRVRWDFSRLFGVYVCVFALVSMLAGKFAFKEAIPYSSWLGLLLIILGGLVIQFGNH
jgi:drug/metabolite transporter superfamily protein YnfA